jgi:hypothetical protein
MPARRSASAIAVEVAAAQVQLEFSKSGWLFQPLAADFGIDAQAESVDSGSASGRLIALVLKVGDAFFSEARAGAWLFRGSNAQLLYWLGQGAQAQLPQYLASERVSCAYYVCVGFTDSDLRQDRLDLVRGICSAREARSRLMVTPRFIDARPKEPASRLRG